MHTIASIMTSDTREAFPRRMWRAHVASLGAEIARTWDRWGADAIAYDVTSKLVVGVASADRADVLARLHDPFASLGRTYVTLAQAAADLALVEVSP